RRRRDADLVGDGPRRGQGGSLARLRRPGTGRLQTVPDLWHRRNHLRRRRQVNAPRQFSPDPQGSTGLALPCKSWLSPVTKVKRVGCWPSRSQTLIGNAIRETPFRVSRADTGRQTRNRVSRKSVPEQSLGTRKTCGHNRRGRTLDESPSAHQFLE